MLRSMTGYGRGECLMHKRRFTAELKAVNHRFFEIGIKMPRVLSAFEDEVKARIGAAASRGKIDVFIGFESFAEGDMSVSVNDILCEAYIRALNEMKDGFGLSGEPDLALLSRIPDIISVEKNAIGEDGVSEMKEALMAALDTALAGFTAMREKEGAALASDLMAKAASLAAMVKSVAERAPLVAEDYAARLRQKVEDALSGADYDESRLIQEITIFADKSCIDEELTRLKSHLDQLEHIIKGGGAVGRKLDFLLQEINREVNTIGSKSNDIEITRTVVNLKSELEKIREQIQNLE